MGRALALREERSITAPNGNARGRQKLRKERKV